MRRATSSEDCVSTVPKSPIFREVRLAEVVEHSCAAGSLLQGESLQNISKDMDIVSYKVPIGVTAGICPFNFPAMIPLWMFPLALIAGNTMVVKPSERDPGATMLLMELLNEVGCPPGVVNVNNFLSFVSG
jgi:malonate-semialdehyde dehydrogenase (acetylating)/methylmalonate-semialdehyde dehydrogenase